MLHRLGPQSDLAKACKVVAFASVGIKLGRPSLYSHAVTLYGELLISLAGSLENPAKAKCSETVIITLLLGLYEVGLSIINHLIDWKNNAF